MVELLRPVSLPLEAWTGMHCGYALHFLIAQLVLAQCGLEVLAPGGFRHVTQQLVEEA
jgi:hypothetical protein